MYRITFSIISILTLFTFYEDIQAQQIAWESIEQFWLDDKWENYEKIWAFVNNDGDTTKLLRFSWTCNWTKPDSCYWSESNKTLIEYDALRRRTREVEYYYSDYWMEIQKTEYYYSPSTVERIISDNELGHADYHYQSRYLTRYNSNNQKIEFIYFSWDTTNADSWKSESKAEYSYDSAGRIIQELGFIYDAQNSSWLQGWRFIHTYTPQHEQLGQHFQDNEWIDYLKSILTYSNGNLIEIEVFLWGNSQWEEWGKETYTYNDSNQQIVRLLFWKTPEGWLNYDRTFYGEVLVSKIDNKQSQQLGINQNIIYSYPNPFNSLTTIHFTCRELVNNGSIKIYNLLGRPIKALADEACFEEGSHKIQWDGTNDDNITLPSGTYFVVLQFDGVIRSYKIALLK